MNSCDFISIIYVNLYEFIVWIVWLPGTAAVCGSAAYVRQCVCGSDAAVVCCNAVVGGSVRSCVRQCAQQCVAVHSIYIR